ncbi:MAG: DUF2332 domain-containing protein [Sphingomonadaceae bacterium]
MAKAASVMDIKSLPEAIEWQARHAEEGGAPGTARVIRGLLAVLTSDTATGRRLAGWQGLTLKDAMPLRINGGLHNLVLTGADPRLGAVYRGELTDQSAVDALVRELVERFDERLLPWLDGPPQTNEAGRSASVMAGLLWLAQRVSPRFELLELGASAGINTMMERYFYDLGGVTVGPIASPMRIVPEWRGPPPPPAKPEIISIRGCDVAPVNLAEPEAALLLKSYVWPEATERMARIDAAALLALQSPPEVVHQNAAAFAQHALARPQQAGVTRVLFHSIVWQYIPDDQQQAVTAAMAEAARSASVNRPLAWLTLETNRTTFRHELHVRYWPGGDEPALLACAHPHGAWVEWLAG